MYKYVIILAIKIQIISIVQRQLEYQYDFVMDWYLFQKIGFL